MLFEYLDKQGLQVLVDKVNTKIKKLQNEVDELKIKNGGNITVKEDLYIGESSLDINKTTTINLNGCELSAKGSEERGDTVIVSGGEVVIENGKIVASEDRKENSGVIRVEGDANVELNGLEIENGNCVYVLSNQTPKVEINNCKLTTTASQCVYVGTGNGKVTINSGEFKSQDWGNVYYTLNLKDSLVNEDGSNVRDFIEVKGGVFYNFNPGEAYCEKVKPVSFVADGYTVIEEVVDENTTKYTVVPETEK